jgi:hypothetical protein
MKDSISHDCKIDGLNIVVEVHLVGGCFSVISTVISTFLQATATQSGIKHNSSGSRGTFMSTGAGAM